MLSCSSRSVSYVVMEVVRVCSASWIVSMMSVGDGSSSSSGDDDDVAVVIASPVAVAV